MNMMTIPECLKALNGRVTEAQLRYSIRQGYVKSLRIGGKVFVDHDTVLADIAQYTPHHSYSGGLVSKNELMSRTGLTRRQVAHGIKEGWIVPVMPPGRRRPMFKLSHVLQYLHTRLTREDGDSGDN